MLQHHKEFNGFRISKLEDVDYLAIRLRFEDKREVLDASGSTPYQALLGGYIQSEICFTIVDTKDVPVGMFGVSKEGAIWFISFR
jgi:hypothetical protein